MGEYTEGFYKNDDLEFMVDGIEYMAEVTARLIRDEHEQEFIDDKKVIFYVGTPEEWIVTELTEELEKKLDEAILNDEEHQRWV